MEYVRAPRQILIERNENWMCVPRLVLIFCILIYMVDIDPLLSSVI